jgi:hypothetical protein
MGVIDKMQNHPSEQNKTKHTVEKEYDHSSSNPINQSLKVKRKKRIE